MHYIRLATHIRPMYHKNCTVGVSYNHLTAKVNPQTEADYYSIGQLTPGLHLLINQYFSGLHLLHSLPKGQVRIART